MLTTKPTHQGSYKSVIATKATQYEVTVFCVVIGGVCKAQKALFVYPTRISAEDGSHGDGTVSQKTVVSICVRQRHTRRAVHEDPHSTSVALNVSRWIAGHGHWEWWKGDGGEYTLVTIGAEIISQILACRGGWHGQPVTLHWHLAQKSLSLG